MKLLWIAISQFQKNNSLSGITSGMASTRYRILMPAMELQKINHHISLAAVTDNVMPPALLDNLDCDAVIFSKIIHEINEKIAIIARERGARVIFDICDNRFEHSGLSERYRNMAGLADVITCNTQGMADIIKRYSDAPCHVIADLCEGQRQPAKFSPGETLNLL
ncbi:MAG: hypothetical protein KGI29_03145 [Pseudomonadota bacterium]|nr:hypothetical protein [Pseudomonadota bacterium]MDE3037454.1 hypothetical protein [Pseudomonadota bacterium]